MNEDNLLYFATDMAEGYEPGSFWFLLLNLIDQPPVDEGYLAERYALLTELFHKADHRNLAALRVTLPGAMEMLEMVDEHTSSRDEALEYLTRTLKLLPWLLTRFAPLSDLIDGIRNELLHDWIARKRAKLLMPRADDALLGIFYANAVTLHDLVWSFRRDFYIYPSHIQINPTEWSPDAAQVLEGVVVEFCADIPVRSAWVGVKREAVSR